MKRVILDTNIYGEIIRFEDTQFMLDNIPKSGLMVYGTRLIRKELRDTPRQKVIVAEEKKRKLRLLLLALYDAIVNGHNLEEGQKADSIANAYFLAYKEMGGIARLEEIEKDFRIISVASINSLDVIYSNDNKTLAHPLALKSYNLINAINKLKTPILKNYEEFKNDIRKSLL